MKLDGEKKITPMGYGGNIAFRHVLISEDTNRREKEATRNPGGVVGSKSYHIGASARQRKQLQGSARTWVMM